MMRLSQPWVPTGLTYEAMVRDNETSSSKLIHRAIRKPAPLSIIDLVETPPFKYG